MKAVFSFLGNMFTLKVVNKETWEVIYLARRVPILTLQTLVYNECILSKYLSLS